jgi:hypothetical protein
LTLAYDETKKTYKMFFTEQFAGKKSIETWSKIGKEEIKKEYYDRMQIYLDLREKRRLR